MLSFQKVFWNDYIIVLPGQFSKQGKHDWCLGVPWVYTIFVSLRALSVCIVESKLYLKKL